MFTGLIEAMGEVERLEPTPAGFRLRLITAMAPELNAGDSLAVNGVCLTVVAADGKAVQADVSPETARVTALGTLAHGDAVNLERPLRADARLGGHFVQGHVDATGTIEAIRRDGDSFWLTVRFPPELAPYIVRKGSIAVDGISLTVAEVRKKSFLCWIIPHTREVTALRDRTVSDSVNLEADLIGKYVEKFVAPRK